MTLIPAKSAARALWAGALVILGLASACPKDGQDDTSISHGIAGSGGSSVGADAGGSGGFAPEGNESEVHPTSLPGFFIVQSGPDAGADAGADGGIDAGIITAPDWCSRAGSAQKQLDVAIEISDDYLERTSTDCETALLTARLSEAQLDDFYSYLTDYALLWFYCPLAFNVPDGGIEVFGPANTATASVGAAATPLGADDAQRLTDYFVAAFAAQMMLTPAEADGLRRYVRGTASITPGASSLLSNCETSP